MFAVQVAEKVEVSNGDKPKWWQVWKSAVEVDDTMVSVDGALPFIRYAS